MVCSVNAQVQRSKNSIFRTDRSDLGLGAGTTFYLGDFNEYYPFMSPRYYGSIFHRFSFNMLHALRTSVSAGQIAGNSQFYDGYMPYYTERYPDMVHSIKFSRTFIDFNIGLELGFAPFEPVLHKMERRFAPYLFLGLGIVLAYPDSYRNTGEAQIASNLYPGVYGTSDNNSSTLQVLNIPIGAGVKWSPWKRWTVGVEWQFKKTFIDDVDRFNNINPNPDLNSDKKGSVLLNTDWISLFGVSLSYRLAPKQKCPMVKPYKPSQRDFKGKNRYFDTVDKKKKK